MPELGLDQFEPLVENERLERVIARLVEGRDDIPDDTNYVTFVVPPVVADVDHVMRSTGKPSMAYFMAISDNPRRRGGPRIATNASCLLADFRDEDAAYDSALRYDPLESIFKLVLKQHATTLTNLRELID
jgi:hypothetical protein